MNILWLINIPLPEASILMNDKPLPFGGWMVKLSDILSEKREISLSVAFPQKGIKDIEILEGNKIKYYLFPSITKINSKDNKYKENLNKILEVAKPDIVHVFGTEFPHTLAMINLCNEKKIKAVINIQGLVSIITKHYLSYLPQNIQNRFTFRDFIKQDNIKQQQIKFELRGKFEVNAIQNAKHVIGRTTWDKACTTQINPNIKYHFCNETLREEFYKHSWDITKCEKFSIFVSQGSYPIKGLHFMLEAMPLILKKHPETRLYIGGNDITNSSTIKDKLKKSSYGKYIKELIVKNNLQNNVIFTGILDEKEMCKRFLSSNIFVCPSSIENSPNSLGEAMILGVPCVASDVGGNSDMLKNKKEGFLYQVDASYMLAYFVCQIFESDELALEFSKNSREHALKTHDRIENLKTLLNIYKEINNE